MAAFYTTCEEAKREHSWYRWQWTPESNRYERECSTMGCDAFEYLEGSLIPEDPPVLARACDLYHAHSWGPWFPIEEFHVQDNRFYGRICPECKAMEECGCLKEIGKTVLFRKKV